MDGKNHSKRCALDGYIGVLLVAFDKPIVRYTITTYSRSTNQQSHETIPPATSTSTSNHIQTPHTMTNQSTQSKIDSNQANLPLPEQPPVASDWQSMDESKVNVGSGKVESHTGTGPHATTGTRGPPANLETAQDDMSKIGRQGKENLSGPPKDAKY